MDEIPVWRASKDELRDIIITLTRAFDDDPFVNWIVKQDDRRRHHIAWAMGSELRGLAFPHREVYTTDGIKGAALWMPPGAARPGWLAEARGLPGLVRAVGLRNLPSRLRGFAAISAKHPKEPHWYLPTLGVAPEYQGMGIGGALLRPILDRCDSETMPAYLESSKERNVPFYESHGFRVTEVFDVPPNGPPLWLMWREPESRWGEAVREAERVLVEA